METVDGTAIFTLPAVNLAAPALAETTVRFPLCMDPISFITGCNLGYRRMPYRLSNDDLRIPSRVSQDAISDIA